jgi:hypothetical protein
MPRTIYVQELGRAFSFPDGTSDGAVSAFFQKNFPTAPESDVPAEVAPLPPTGPDESSILGRLAYGFGTGLTNIPGGIAALGLPAEKAAQTSAGQFSEGARKYLQETFGIDPTKDPTAAQQAAEALGSVASFLVPGSAVAKGASLIGRTASLAGRAGTATAAAQGVALGSGARAEKIQNQLASGMEISEEDQLAAQRLDGLIGSLEAAPIGRFFGPISTLLSKVPVAKAPIVEQIVKSRLARITKAGAAEGAQEVASGIANDLVEYGVYNPDVEFGQDLLSNAGTGAFAGSFVEGLVQLAAGRKLKPYRQLQEDLGREAAVNAQSQRQGEISRAAEELRKVNVEGDVEIIEDDFDGISRFTIRTPGGNTVGDFLDAAEAEEAVGIYKERTDANITVRKPADLPSVFPVKLNGKEYQTTDEIIAERDSLVSKSEGLASYMSRPDVIKREAERQNVSEALIRKATAEEVADMDKKISKLNEFVAAAKPTPDPTLAEGDLRSQFAAPEAVVPEAMAPEAPIGAAEPVSAEAPITEAPAVAEPVEPSVEPPIEPPAEPEEPRPSVGQLKEAPVVRRTLSQAEAEGPILRDYNQATIDRYAGIYTALKSRLSGKVPKNAEVKLEELISTPASLLVRGQARMEKTPNGIKSIVDLSTGILRPNMTVEEAVNELVETLDHEIIHVLRDQGVIRPAEWGMLSKAAINTKVPGRSYTYLDKAQAVYTPYGEPISEIYSDPDAVIEEAVAEMYKDWVKGQRAPVQIRGLFNRITEFFRSIFRILKSDRYKDVFKAIDTGEIGAREGVGREGVSRLSAGPTTNRAPGSPMSNDLNDRQAKAFRLYPYLRTSAPRYYDHNRMILAGTDPGNAATQITNLDTLLARHPNTLASNEAFADYLADAMGNKATPETGVPMVPYGAVRFARDPSLIANQLRRMTPGQLQMAEEGLSAAKDFEAAYRGGTATPVQTAKLILWGILSRGVSPFVQESMFLDVVKPVGISNRTGQMQGGIDQFINDAVDGEFDLEAYQAYIKTLKLDGLPGAGTTHNLGAFGRTTLVKLQQRIPDGRTILQYLHDLISDYSLSGKEIRRRFHEVNPGIGINNKVLSFMMLVSGRDDVLVLDRVQMRNQYNDGRFNDYNLYDGETIEKEVQKSDGTTKLEDVADDGTGIAKMGDGVFGLMYYEALERDLMDPVRQAYAMIGRPNDFSMGRYHWESWVATSSQEVDHGSISGLIKEATGEADPYSGIYTGEGKYDTFNSGIKYGYTRDGQAYVALPDGLGNHYFFTPEFAKKVIKGYQKKSTRIIRDDTFKVSESTQGPWYDRPEVDKQALRQYLITQTESFRNESGRPVSKRVPQAGQADPNRPGPGPVHAKRRRGGVRQPPVTYPKEGTARFSAAPALNSEEFKRWFRNSRIVDSNGRPLVVYHGTQGKFKAFDTAQSELGSHFGTKNQANEFVQTPESEMSREGWAEAVRFEGRTDQIFPVYLSMQNPIRMKDTGRWIPSRIAKRLQLEGMLTPEQSKYISSLPLNTPVQIKALQKLLKDSGVDGIVYLNRYEGFKPKTNPTEFATDAEDLSDEAFKAKYPEAQDSYLIFDPVQVKSIFNEFEEGAATSPRFSAAPLPPYVEAKNRTLFVPERKESIMQSIFDFFNSPATQAKTLSTVYGQIDLKGGYFGTRAAINRRMSLVDKNAYIEFLEKTANEKDTGNFQRREATQSALVALGMVDRSSQLTAASVMQGAPVIEYSRPGDIQSATVAVRNDADKLIDIFRVMLEPGPVDPLTNKPRDKRVVFKSYATAMRAIGLKAAGKPVPRELDDVYINTTIQSVQRDYPEIVEAYNKYQRFNKKLITAARDAGRITDAELAKFTQQMDYYGFYREVYEEQLVPGMTSKLAGDIKIREYKGSERGELIEDPMLVILTNVNFWMGAITRNIAVNKAFKLANDMGEARLLGASEKPDLSQGESEQVMFFRERGVQKRFAVKDPMLVVSLGADDRADMGFAMKLIGMPTTALRESVTRDPVFMIRNLLRDTLSSWITSGEDITPFIGTIQGYAKALNNSTSYQALVGRGVVGSHDLAMRSPAEMAAIIRRRASPKNIMNIASADGMQGLLMSAWDKLGVWSEASDAATRIAVYESAIKQGMSEAEAAFRAVEIMNFSRRGSSSFLQLLTRLVPFLNARIQGMDVLYQSGKAGVLTASGYQLGERDANLGKKFLYRGAILAALSVALEMMLDGDEDHEELPDYVKNGNLLLPLKLIGLDGYFAAVPKPFEAGLLFSTIPQELYKATTGQTSNREMAKFFWSEFVSTFGLNPMPQIALPAFEAITNYDFYTGLPLISEGKARLTPELQYDSRTSSVAMMLSGLPISYNFTTGRFEGVSPIIIDQIISGYGGPLGTYIMQGTGLLMEWTGAAEDRLPRDVTQLPGIKSFLLDAESRNPKSVAQAYELFRVVDEVNRSFSRLRQTGDVEATMDYLERNKDILAYKKHIYKLFDGLNKLSARERQIERDSTMTRDEKLEAMKQLREVRARLTSNISEINKALGR